MSHYYRNGNKMFLVDVNNFKYNTKDVKATVLKKRKEWKSMVICGRQQYV